MVNGVDGETVTIGFKKQGKFDAVSVHASRDLPRFFSSMFSSSSLQTVSVGASAYSAPQRVGACVLALSPTGTGLELGGTADIDATGCSLHSNALRNDSFDPWGSSHAIAECITTVQTSHAASGQYTLNLCDAIEDYVDPIVDPYASVPIPAVGNGETAIDGPYITQVSYKTSRNGDSLGSGVYEHLLIDSDTVIDNNATIVIENGSLEFKGNNSASGTNVTFILLDSNMKTGSQFNMNLSAKTTGTYAGLLFVGDRNANFKYHDLRGGATTTLTGAVYFPTDELEMTGGSQATSGCFHVIAGQIELNGNSKFGNVCGGAGTKLIGEDSPGGIKFVN